MKVRTDLTKCVGAGMCVLTAPHTFDQDERRGLVKVLNPTPPAADQEAVREAASLCPARAILLSEIEAGGAAQPTPAS